MTPGVLGHLDVYEVDEVDGWANTLGEDFGIMRYIGNSSSAYAQVRGLRRLSAPSKPHTRRHMRPTTHEIRPDLRRRAAPKSSPAARPAGRSP